MQTTVRLGHVFALSAYDVFVVALWWQLIVSLGGDVFVVALW